MRRWTLVPALFALSALALSACGGPAFVRGDEHKDLDKYAMSTGLDKVDLEKLFAANTADLKKSRIVRKWHTMANEGNEPSVAIFPIQNDTSEHIDSQLQALLSKFETQLVKSGDVAVLSHERQRMLVEELKRQGSAVFDPDKAAALGKQLGVKYFITGKIRDSAEKSGSERRVQYFLFMQVVEVETGRIWWQNEADLTKGLVN